MSLMSLLELFFLLNLFSIVFFRFSIFFKSIVFSKFFNCFYALFSDFALGSNDTFGLFNRSNSL